MFSVAIFKINEVFLSKLNFQKMVKSERRSKMKYFLLDLHKWKKISGPASIFSGHLKAITRARQGFRGWGSTTPGW